MTPDNPPTTIRLRSTSTGEILEVVEIEPEPTIDLSQIAFSMTSWS